MEDYIIWLENAGPKYINMVGGKGANLGELTRGLSSPPGFVISSLNYKNHMEQHRTKEDVLALVNNHSVDDLVKLENLSNEISQKIISLPMLPHTLEVITNAYNELIKKKGSAKCLVAVRSSATAEDRDDASFAGQQETFLNVDGLDNVLEAVKKCWASLWTARAIHYRSIKGYSNETVQMAVIIQEMLPAELSGVMFTANPVSNSRKEILIEASHGLGENLVSGNVTGDNYVINKDGIQIKSKTIADVGKGQLLSDEKIRELANTGIKIEFYYDGNYQDIEWAYYKGEFYFLQSRPITTLADEEPEDINWDKLNPIQKEVLVTIYERFPEPVYPIDGITVKSFFKGQFDAMEIFGYNVPDIDWTRVDKGLFPEFFIPPNIRPNYKQLFLLLKLWSNINTETAKAWNEAQAYLSDRLQKLRDLDFDMFPSEVLLEYLDEAIAKFHAFITLRYEYFAKNRLPYNIFKRIIEFAFGEEGLEIHLNLLLGIDCITLQINEELRKLAHSLQGNQLLKKLVIEGNGDLREEIEKIPGGIEFNRKFNTYLEKYGDRETTIGLGGMANPTWKESPEVVFGIIKSILTEEPGAEEERKRRIEKQRLDAEEKINKHFNNGIYKLLPVNYFIKKLIKHNQSYAVFREDSHYDMTRGLSVIKEILMELSSRFVKKGLVNEENDVFYLTYYEVRKIIIDLFNHKKVEPRKIKELIEARKLERIRRISRWKTRDVNVYNIDCGQLIGIPSGGGATTGPAKIIKGPEDFYKLKAGDIMVAPYTNPAWTPLFATAAGIVVDVGGAASHAAIIAREYGIPAVMGLACASDTIKDGDIITINGNTGIVLFENS